MASIVKFDEPKTAMLLKVTAGIHDGVSLPLDGKNYLVGSATDCDLTLSDSDISEHHMTFQLQGSVLLVEAIGGEVMINDEMLVPVGHGIRATVPLKIQIGSSRLLLSSPIANKDAAHRMPRAGWVAVTGAALSFLTVAAVQTGVGDFLGSKMTVDSRSTGNVKAVANLHPATSRPTAAVLERKLAQAGLSGLKVDADGTRLTVSGELSGKDQRAWNDIQGWFDRTYGGAYVLTSLVGPMAPKAVPKFELQAVWFGKVPYAIGSDGTRLYKGAALNDGWIIKDIHDGRLVASRQGEEFVLTF